MLCGVVLLVLIEDYGWLTLTTYDSTAVPPRPKVTTEH